MVGRDARDGIRGCGVEATLPIVTRKHYLVNRLLVGITFE
jgi:hypothetical protein